MPKNYFDEYVRKVDIGVHNPLSLRAETWIKSLVPAPFAAQAGKYPITGIDTSVYQGAMNWNTAAQKINFAYVRAGAGNNYVDPEFPRSRDELKRIGIPFGLYWYCKPVRDWRQHAQNFYDNWKNAGSRLPPVLDVETNDGLGKTALESWLMKLTNDFEQKAGVPVSIYTSPDWWNVNMPLTNWAKKRGLWDAHWTSADNPILPHEWANVANPTYPKKWLFWQYSANGNGKGAEYGAQSRDLDLDRYYGNATDFIADFGVAPYSPTVVPPLVEEGLKPAYIAEVTSFALNMRSGNGSQFTDIGTLIKNSQVPVMEENGEWVRIEGWVNKGYIRRL